MRAHLCVRVFVLEDPDSPSLVYDARGGTARPVFEQYATANRSLISRFFTRVKTNCRTEKRARSLPMAKNAPDAARISAPPRSISSKDTARVDIQYRQERGITII